jgi:hypothetical protein
MKSSHLIYILLILVIGGILSYLGYWFYHNFEYETKTVEVGFKGKARDNSFLAAERLLERMGTPAKTVQTLPKIESNLNIQDTLVLFNYNAFLSEKRTEQLLNWVDEGGHLIITSETIYDVLGRTNQYDPLLKILGIYRYQNALENSKIVQALPTEFIWIKYPLKVTFNPDYHLEYSREPAEQIDDQYGTHLLFYYWGNGMINVLSDLEFLDNTHIGKVDNAQFLWLLVNLERPAKQVWFVEVPASGDGMDIASETQISSFWVLLWNHTQAIIITTSILLFFWLWAVSRRFGSILPPPPRTRRRLLEHIEASGHFLWRQGQAHVLLHSTRQALLKRLDSVHPDWIRLSQVQLSQKLAQVCNFPAPKIEKALQNTQPDNEIDFTQTIQILTQIRKTL